MGVLSKGTDFSNGQQITDSSLDALVDNASFTVTAVDADSTTLSQTGAIIVRDGGIKTAKLENSTGTADGVTTVKIADEAITTAKIDDLAVTTAKLAEGAVTAAKMEYYFFDDTTGVLTLSGTAPGITTAGSLPIVVTGDVTLTDGGTERIKVGGTASKDESGVAAAGIKVTGCVYATQDIVADGDVVADLDSDVRLKDNVTPIVDPIEKVKALSGNTFTWNDLSRKTGEDDVGVIAQEVRELFPSAVREKDDGFLKVDYVRLVPVLIEAVKKLAAKVEELEGK